MEVAPLGGAEELGDVPAPKLVGPSGEQLGCNVTRVAQLGAAFADLVILGEDAVHRALRAEVSAFIEERGVDLGGGEVSEAGLVQDVEDGTAFFGLEGSRIRNDALVSPRIDSLDLGRYRTPPLFRPRGEGSVVGGAREVERRTGGSDAQLRRNLGDGQHQSCPSFSSSL